LRQRFTRGFIEPNGTAGAAGVQLQRWFLGGQTQHGFVAKRAATFARTSTQLEQPKDFRGNVVTQNMPKLGKRDRHSITRTAWVKQPLSLATVSSGLPQMGQVGIAFFRGNLRNLNVQPWCHTPRSRVPRVRKHRQVCNLYSAPTNHLFLFFQRRGRGLATFRQFRSRAAEKTDESVRVRFYK
jgi:hypothetical protein